MFLCDMATASFNQEQPSLWDRGLNLAVGSTPTGMLLRAGTAASLVGGVKGFRAFKNFKDPSNVMRRKYYQKKLADSVLENAKTAKQNTLGSIQTVGKVGVGLGAAGVGAVGVNEARKYHEKKNRKWWEIL